MSSTRSKKNKATKPKLYKYSKLPDLDPTFLKIAPYQQTLPADRFQIQDQYGPFTITHLNTAQWEDVFSLFITEDGQYAHVFFKFTGEQNKAIGRLRRFIFDARQDGLGRNKAPKIIENIGDLGVSTGDLISFIRGNVHVEVEGKDPMIRQLAQLIDQHLIQSLNTTAAISPPAP